MSSDFRVKPGQVYWSCAPTGGASIRVTAVGQGHATVADVDSDAAPRHIPLESLHNASCDLSGVPRRAGYALATGRIDARPVVAHIEQLLLRSPGTSLRAIARQANVSATSVKELVRKARQGKRVQLHIVNAHRLLLVNEAALRQQLLKTDDSVVAAAPVVDHVRQLMKDHPGLSLAALAEAAQVRPTTLSSAARDVEAGRARSIEAMAAAQLLELGRTIPLPEPELVDAAPLVAHVRNLQQQYERASVTLIAKMAGLSRQALTRALNKDATGQHRSVSRETVRKVLAVRQLPASAARRRTEVTDVGIIRRVQALHALGWRTPAVAQAGGSNSRAVNYLLTTRKVTPSARRAVLAAWAELSHLPGPSAAARQDAAARGWAPPLAWDEGGIDDPKAAPIGMRAANRKEQWDPTVLRFELDFLAALGLSWTQSLDRLHLGSQRALELLQGQGSSDRPCPDSSLQSGTQGGGTHAA